MKKQNTPHIINSISEQHRLLGLPKPKHPMISVFGVDKFKFDEIYLLKNFSLNFYCITIKKNFTGKLKYGQRYYDFDEGMLSFISPNQLLSKIQGDDTPTEGISLMFHPDFMAGYPLAKKIKNYGFFSYELNEALHLSEQEEIVVESIMKNIEIEYQSNIDNFSQDVIIAQIELLLQYSNRFYNRQFITRKIANDDILIRLENLLSDYFTKEKTQESGLPTVQSISEQLHLSPNYLSDMLRTITGQTTQQHIHIKLIEKAQELLTTTSMPVSEIAYTLGFEYPQSFNKLFKNKTKVSPLEYRQSFN
jgi:AraC-like DNA-binding protein